MLCFWVLVTWVWHACVKLVKHHQNVHFSGYIVYVIRRFFFFNPSKTHYPMFHIRFFYNYPQNVILQISFFIQSCPYKIVNKVQNSTALSASLWPPGAWHYLMNSWFLAKRLTCVPLCMYNSMETQSFSTWGKLAFSPILKGHCGGVSDKIHAEPACGTQQDRCPVQAPGTQCSAEGPSPLSSPRRSSLISASVRTLCPQTLPP